MGANNCIQRHQIRNADQFIISLQCSHYTLRSDYCMNHTAMKSIKLTTLPLEINSAMLAYEFFKPLGNLEVEEVWALALGPSLKSLRAKMIFRGSVSSCLVHPREIFRFALTENASNLILAHNHPSQETNPSTEDLKMTNQLIMVGRLIEIPLLDHLIITRKAFVSLREAKWCEF